jgi:hypothetical protein
MADKFVEPPDLFDRNGERIGVFRNSDGTFFSNHPDYPMALALHEQAEKAAAEKKAADDAAAVTEVEEDETVQPDNDDGKIEYTEMNSKDLVSEAKSRGLTLPTGVKRTQVIAALEADDASKTTAG